MRRREFIAGLMLAPTMRAAIARQRAKTKRITIVMPAAKVADISLGGRACDGSYSPDGKLTHQGFHAIKRTLADAKSFELQYSDAAQARDAIIDLCHG